MKSPYLKFPHVLMIGVLCLGLTHIHAQDETAPEASSDESAGITQGEAALLLARKLGFFVGSTRPMDVQNAIKVLLENKISPFNGWRSSDPLTAGDLARLLVQSLNRADEIPEADRDNPETTAYRDLLEREYGMDLNKIIASLRRVPGSKDPKGTGPLDDSASSDPLEGRSGDGDVDELGGGSPVNLNTPVNESILVAALRATAPTPGDGDSGQVGEGSNNVTPSTPSP